MSDNTEKDTGVKCDDHKLVCYKITEIEQELAGIHDILKGVVTKGEIQDVVRRMEDAIIDLKNADKMHYTDIGLIQQSIAGIHESINAFKDSQKEMRDDYKSLHGVVNNIYMLLQQNANCQIKQAQNDAKIAQSSAKIAQDNVKASTVTSLNFLAFLFNMFKKPWFVVVFCVVTLVLMPIVFRHQDEVVSIIARSLGIK